MLDNKLLLENIKKLCDSKGIKITNLEKELGFGGGIISRWGNNADPSLSKIIDIADYFHVTLDEIVGRNDIIEDEFINKLIQMTECKQLIWHSYSEDEDSKVKQYFDAPIDARDFCDPEDFFDYVNSHLETSYYAKFGNGYISIHANHLKHKIYEPYELCILLQADSNSELVTESYETKELFPLWIKILMSLEKDKPDEIKVADLKQQILSASEEQFILDNYEKCLNKIVGCESEVDELVQDEKIREILTHIKSPEIEQLIKIFTDPKMVEAMNSTMKLAQYFTEIKTQKEIPINNKRAGD